MCRAFAQIPMESHKFKNNVGALLRSLAERSLAPWKQIAAIKNNRTGRQLLIVTDSYKWRTSVTMYYLYSGATIVCQVIVAIQTWQPIGVKYQGHMVKVQWRNNQ